MEGELLADRRPQIKNVLVLDDQECIIQAMIAEQDSIVRMQLGAPSSSSFALKGARLRWEDMLQAWRPMATGGLLRDHRTNF